MTKEQLQTRIEKKEKQIAKVEKRITKWSKGLSQEAIDKCSACELDYKDPEYDKARKEWNQYKDSHSEEELYNQDDLNKGPNFDELRSAYIDLAEQKATLNKYKVALDKETNFQKMEKIETIWKFLQQWKKDAFKYFNENAKEYTELRHKLRHKEEEETKKYIAKYIKDNNLEKLNWKEEYHLSLQFKKEYYRNIHSVTRSLYQYTGRLDEEKLNIFLNKTVEEKYNNLVQTITKKAGEITDATNLNIGPKGDINGYVQGTKNKVHVQTIGAGGYNIQIFHYRTLVNVAKN